MKLPFFMFLFIFLISVSVFSQNTITNNQYYRIEGILDDKDSSILRIADSCYFFIKFIKRNKFEIRVSTIKDSINSSCCYEWKEGKVQKNTFSPYCYSNGRAKQKKDILYFYWKKLMPNELYRISNKTNFIKFYHSMNSAMKICENANEILLIPLYSSSNKSPIVLKEGDFQTTFN